MAASVVVLYQHYRVRFGGEPRFDLPDDLVNASKFAVVMFFIGVTVVGLI